MIEFPDRFVSRDERNDVSRSAECLNLLRIETHGESLDSAPLVDRGVLLERDGGDEAFRLAFGRRVESALSALGKG